MPQEFIMEVRATDELVFLLPLISSLSIEVWMRGDLSL
jgi:hypothetical protein